LGPRDERIGNLVEAALVDRGHSAGNIFRAGAMVLGLGLSDLGNVGLPLHAGYLPARDPQWLAAQEVVMAFFRGQKVVYIGPDYRQHPTAIKYAVNVPSPSQVYTTRSGLLHCVVDGTPGYLLEERE